MDIDLDFSDVKPSVLNWVIVGLLAISFISVSKFVVNQYRNPVTDFIRDMVNAV